MSGRILVIGAGGQLGVALCCALAQEFGEEQVLATDLNPLAAQKLPFCRFEILDAQVQGDIDRLVKRERITQIYHLAAVLSAKAESRPLFSWELNMSSLLNVLEVARENKLNKVFWPSSIAVFGPDSPKVQTPQDTLTHPLTAYGISKVAGERWCAYYYQKYGVDVRSLRYPGLIGHEAQPGGGTTDYAVDIFHHAVQQRDFVCFLEEHAVLPMMYMTDAIRATVALMKAPASDISIRYSYNIAGMSFSPAELYQSILKQVPGFRIDYRPDFRMEIANSWPDSINDSCAQMDWGWKPAYDLDTMTQEMLQQLAVSI